MSTLHKIPFAVSKYFEPVVRQFSGRIKYLGVDFNAEVYLCEIDGDSGFPLIVRYSNDKTLPVHGLAAVRLLSRLV